MQWQPLWSIGQLAAFPIHDKDLLVQNISVKLFQQKTLTNTVPYALINNIEAPKYYQTFRILKTPNESQIPILITFINQINGRSYRAHVDKLGLEVIKPFDFNGNHYYELGYDMSRKRWGSIILRVSK